MRNTLLGVVSGRRTGNPHRGLLVGLLLLATTGVAAQSSDPEVAEHLQRSQRYWITNQWVSAIGEANAARQIALRKHGIDSLEVADAEVIRSFAAMQTDDYFVLPYLQHALAVREKYLPKGSPAIGDVLTQIGYYWNGHGARPELAVDPLLRAVEIYRKQDPTNQLTNVLWNLARAYELSNQRRLALNVHQELAGIYQQKHGSDSQWFAYELREQARILETIGEHESSAALKAKASAIFPLPTASELLPDSSLGQVGFFASELFWRKEYAEAERLLRQAINSDEAKSRFLGDVNKENLDNANLLLVDVLIATKRFAEAETILTAALTSPDRNAGYNNAKYLQTLAKTIELYGVQKRYTEGDRIVAVIEAYYKRKNRTPTLFEANAVIDYYTNQSRFNEALSWARRVWQPVREGNAFASPERAEDWLAEQRAARNALQKHIQVIRAGFPTAFEKNRDLLDEGFEVAQLVRASNVGQNVAKMAARRAKAGDSFAIRLREVQDKYARYRLDEAQFSRLMAEVEAGSGNSIERKRQELMTRRAEIEMKERELSADFPQYASLVRPSPLPVSEVTKLLRPDEALISYTVDTWNTYVSIIRSNAGYHTFTVGRQKLDELVRDFRSRLTSGEMGTPTAMSPSDGEPLFRFVFQGLDAQLVGVKHIFVVPDGPLQSVPFAALPDSKEPNADWLAKSYAFSYLPSVASLRALRAATPASADRAPFVGFGDPELNDAKAATNLSLSSVYKGGQTLSRGLANVDMLRDAPSLPETADELRSVATALGATDSTVHLRKAATESAVRKMDLSTYRIVSFATHGVMAGELSDGAEPGLVLTPPLHDTTEDDGYLAASEVASLRLNADWVLLSACNTAAPNGTPGAEGFSGLTSAFLYAGANSVLASHWRVSSSATTELVSKAIANFARDSNLGKAVALQKAMIEMMAEPRYSHPYYWAPFAVVGD